MLIPESTSASERSAVTIREDAKGRILLTGLNQVTINSFEDLMDALNFGSSIRQTDSTAINAKSSRSHAVFSLNLIQRKSHVGHMTTREKRMSMPVDGFGSTDSLVTVDSKLHFVDLAGSERLKNTHATGERAREGISINAGLASLGKVISQLSSRQSGAHVSYRDSKLTRLLQDSLGGSAITYMVACVTPAEFHLSETLNTVQYAQRARAIQSKPRIQQVSDESDKQAVIERLKAEVAFLRQQIRSSESGDRKSIISIDRGERSNERELELQNSLLDMQESYTALSQRHAKLIAEITRASDLPADDPEALAAAIGNSSMERLKRSHIFAESVEQVVLEYEKTIQSLESSLSNTRTSLSNTESSLLERETKCAYVETMNSQLQSRLQKMMDRESSTEGYLHELETKIDSQTTGEEKTATLIVELRKELTRARENEAGCEDYISTLEERLAESEQNLELMQREIMRLEQVVERQRNIGKLDNLLYELDHFQQNTVKLAPQAEPVSALPFSLEAKKLRSRGASLDTLAEAAEIAIPDGSDEDLDEIPEEVETTESITETEIEDLDAVEELPGNLNSRSPTHQPAVAYVESSAQSNFVAEKLENVTQELLDLRVQHDTIQNEFEATQNEYELLSAKYEEALRRLSELQDAVDESRHHPTTLSVTTSATASRPTSFLEDGVVVERKDGAQRSSSRSLSSELSLAEDSATSLDVSDAESIPKKATDEQAPAPDAAMHEEMDRMRTLLHEHEEGMALVAQQYAHLQAEHEDTLSLVEELKTEVQKSKAVSPPPTPSPVIRRITSQILMSTVDRAHRSLAALRNIAVEEFEHRPETMQNFEQTLDVAMLELHTRMERIQALEAENASVKKEMETKSTIISGLTRERSSLQGSRPMDMAVVTQMREQLAQKETQIRHMQEAHDKREKELAAEVESLNQLLASQSTESTQRHNESLAQHSKEVEALETELADWKTKHRDVVQSLETSHKQLETTLTELESTVMSLETMRVENAAAADALAEKAVAAERLEIENAQQQTVIGALKNDIDYHKNIIDHHLQTISTLENAHTAAREELSRHISNKETSDADVADYRLRISELESQLEDHKSLVGSQKAELHDLQETHERELNDLRSNAAAEASDNSQLAEQHAQYEQAINTLKYEVSKSKEEATSILSLISRVLNDTVTPMTLPDQLEDLVSEKNQLASKYAELVDSHETLTNQLVSKQGSDINVDEIHAQHDAQVTELATLVANLEEGLRQKEELVKKKSATIDEITAEKEKSLRLVEELEDQITNTFDQHHNRLSVIQNERTVALEEANIKVASLEREAESYRARIEQLEIQLKNSGTPDPTLDRSSSLTSNLRKSTSAVSLPSPPPAIPLPPLPTIATTASSNPGSISPPSSRHTSKELVSAQLVEDQEARIRTIEKHLYAEKQLTATLEEALGDLEAQSNKVKADMEAWKKKAWQYEDELQTLRKERNSTRLSLQQVEEERNARREAEREAEAARAQLEERMNAISKKKKKSTLNCF